LNASAESAGKKLSVLIEINVGGEAAKTGVAATAEELEPGFARRAAMGSS